MDDAVLTDGAGALGWLWGTARPDLTLLIGVPIAIVATAHIVLRKREVPAAIAWIGFVWLAPLLGPLLYVLFGISRVRRRAREARRGLRDGGPGGPASAAPADDPFGPLKAAVDTITGQAITAGNRLSVLRNGDEAYPAMLAAIERASISVVLSSYIMRADETGRTFIDALAAAQARGARVRVILDGVGSGYFLPGAFGGLRRRGVPVQRFMHSALPWRMPFLNLRTHKKLLVVDDRVAFVGGLNIADENRPSRRRRGAVRDTHFRVEGPVVAQLAADFARDWFFVAGESLPVPDPGSIAPLAGGVEARAVSSGPDEDIEKIEFVILQACAAARRTITLMTPYFLPGDLTVTALAMAAMRGVTVDLLIPARSNHVFVDWASRPEVGPLLDRGVRIWLVPGPFDHSKLLVVDRAWCLVGSANMDVRSLRLNFELDVEAYDPTLGGALVAIMDDRKSKRLTRAMLDRRPLPIRLRDAATRLALPYL